MALIIVKIDSITVFLSPSLCTKRSILLRQGNSTDAVFKWRQAKIWRQRSKISCYTEYKAFGPSLIYNTELNVVKIIWTTVSNLKQIEIHSFDI